MVAKSASKKELFPQVVVHDEERDSLIFLWSADNKTNDLLVEYSMISTPLGAI